jgi:hypothetical protein
MRMIDGKFHVKGSKIIKTSSGEVVPEDEPLMLFRARDHLALSLLVYYRRLSELDGCTDYHMAGVDARIAKFVQFANDHPERMKQPGITRGMPFDPVKPGVK